MTIAFDGGLTCSLGVSDLERSIAWYRDVLGVSLAYKLGAVAWCELATPVARVSLGLGKVEQAGGHGGATLTFGVTDIDAARDVLQRAQVQQDGEMREWRAWCAC